jgi:UDP-N-acetylmuramate: L-alanyl-gamma-D-glutamyl-meso-diaminopimelate ligase
MAANCKVASYGTPKYKTENGLTSWIENDTRYPLNIFGKHNLQNMNGARKICELLGITSSDFLMALISFQGTARRLEPIKTKAFFASLRDFGHAPSKAEATVNAVKEQYPDKKLIAIFELHTYSSLRKDFLSHYKGSLDGADTAVVYCNPHVFELKKMPFISVDEIQQGFGRTVEVINERGQLQEFIQTNKSPDKVLLLMSSGNFDGLPMAFDS